MKEVNFDKLKYALTMWSSLLAKLGDTPFTAYMADFPEDKRKYVKPYRELVLWLFKQSNHTITSIVYAIFDQMKDKNSPQVKKYVEMIDEVKKELGDLLSDDAVFFYPTFPSYAPKHGESFRDIWRALLANCLSLSSFRSKEEFKFSNLVSNLRVSIRNLLSNAFLSCSNRYDHSEGTQCRLHRSIQHSFVSGHPVSVHAARRDEYAGRLPSGRYALQRSPDSECG